MELCSFVHDLLGLKIELHGRGSSLSPPLLVAQAGRARALQQQISSKPRDAQIQALETGLAQESQRAKELELESAGAGGVG